MPRERCTGSAKHAPALPATKFNDLEEGFRICHIHTHESQLSAKGKTWPVQHVADPAWSLRSASECLRKLPCLEPFSQTPS